MTDRINFLRYLLDLGDSLGDVDEDEDGEEEGERRLDAVCFLLERFLCLERRLLGFFSGVTSKEFLALEEFFRASARLVTLAVAAWAA